MAKKNFNAGLEDIFKNPTDSSEGDTLVQSKKSVSSERSTSSGGATAEAAQSKKKSYRKNFTYDLSNLLNDAFTESKEVGDNIAKETRESEKSPKKRIKKVPLTGINALIRRTLDSDYDGGENRNYKRVTFICDRDKIAKLKKIAKAEKVYLKDILSDLIDKYIKNFDVKIN